MHRTPDQIMAELRWEAACERLRNALRAPSDRPTDETLSRDEALEVVQESFLVLRRSYKPSAGEAEFDVPATTLKKDV